MMGVLRGRLVCPKADLRLVCRWGKVWDAGHRFPTLYWKVCGSWCALNRNRTTGKLERLNASARHALFYHTPRVRRLPGAQEELLFLGFAVDLDRDGVVADFEALD